MALMPQSDEEWAACQRLIHAMRGGKAEAPFAPASLLGRLANTNVKPAERPVTRLDGQRRTCAASAGEIKIKMTGKYNIIYADPPWDYRDKRQNDPDYGGITYPTQTVSQIAAMPVHTIAAWDSALLMWATTPTLKEALYIMQCWGFEYKTVAFNWVKTYPKSGAPYFGMGNWTRSGSEFCLLGTHGKMERNSKSVPQVLMSPVMGHSRKPDKVRALIVELLGDWPRIELYARQRSPGWDAWGNEIRTPTNIGDMPAYPDAPEPPQMELEMPDDVNRPNAKLCRPADSEAGAQGKESNDH